MLKGRKKYFSIGIGLIIILFFSAFASAKSKDNLQGVSLTPPVYTSKGAIEIVQKYISEGHEDELFTKYAVVKPLEPERLLNMQMDSECSKYINNVIKEDKGQGTSTVDLIDIDNDNEEEIVVYEYTGGSAGYAYISVIKKDKSGTYKFSEYPNYEDIFSLIWSRHALISCEGKNYYIEKEYNYSTNMFEGINIYSFDKGKIAEHTFVSKYSDKLKLSTEFILGKEYIKLKNKVILKAEKVLSCLKNGDIFYGEEEKKVPEKIRSKIKDDAFKAEDWREADINNDSKPELIGRGSSWMKYQRFFNLTVLSKSRNEFRKVDLRKSYDLALHGSDFITEQFWTEKFSGKTYAVMLIRDTEKNVYHFKVFLLEKAKAKKAIDIKAAYIKQTSSKTWTDGINVQFKHAEKLMEGL